MTARLASLLGVDATLSHGMPVVQLAAMHVRAAATELRDQHGYDVLLDVTAVDWIGRSPRFEVVWHFFSSRDCTRVRLKTWVDEKDPAVDSLVTLYGSAAFMERECHEMLGIRFRGNDDLRPILLYEGFVGHPLRKDYDKHHEQPLVRYRDARGS
jgi:NADH-quinone oxidoreductase subunit C